MRRRAALFGVGLVVLLTAATAFAAVGGLTQKAGTAACVSETGTGGACADVRALDGLLGAAVSPDGRNLYTLSENDSAVAVFDRSAAGELTQKTGTAACISEDGSGGTCVDGRGILSASGAAVSPDGRNVYVAADASDGVAIFDRDTATGALTQKPGLAGCITETGTGGSCTDGNALLSTTRVAVSPDGASVYTVSGNSAIAVFDRNPTTGALTQKPGAAGCVSNTGADGCTDGTALSGTRTVSVSPDGANVYVASGLSDAIAIFDRNASGALTQKPGLAGCVSETGAGPCADGNSLVSAHGVTTSFDGANVYLVSTVSDSIAVFDRSPGSGALTQKPGGGGCISETGAGGCTDAVALDAPYEIELTADGSSAYVISSNSQALSVFDRNPATGTLAQKPGSAACVSETGAAPCADGVAMAMPRGLTSSPDGVSVYVIANNDDAVDVFDREIPPETTIDSGPDGPTNDATATFGFSSSEAGSTFECSVDAGAFGACSGPGAVHTTAELADGAHTFAVRAIDPAANADPTPASREFVVDTKAPDTKLTKKPKKKLRTEKAKVKAKAKFKSEAGATFECKLDKGKFKKCSSPFKAKAKAKAGKGKKHKLYVRATDAAGNVEKKPAKASFRAIRE